MSLIELGSEYDSVEEAKAVPEGLYDLRIINVGSDTDDAGRLKGLSLTIEPDVSGHDLDYDAANIFHYITLPNDEIDSAIDSQKGKEPGSTKKFKQLMFKRFAKAFNVDVQGSQFDPNDLLGKEARLNVVHDEYQGNINAKLVLPRLEG